MKRLLLLIFNGLLAISLMAQADSVAVDSVATQKSTFITPSLVFDYGKAAVSLSGIESKYEGAISLLFYDQYYLTAELGQAVLTPENAIENGNYQSEGTYFRIGGGYIKSINPTSKMGLGVRYAVSNFSDQGEIRVESRTGVQEDYNRTFDRSNLSAQWLEVVLTSESKLRILKNQPESRLNELFSIGFQLRLRIMSSYDRFSPVDVYSVPGFGRVVNDPVPAVNLYLRFHPF